MRKANASAERLHRVAEIYNDEANYRPTSDIAELYGVTNRSAERWIREARECSLITRPRPIGGPQSAPHQPKLRDKHGYYACYQAGCRCAACRTANTERLKASRKKRLIRISAGDKNVPHGTKSAYVNWGCRCDPCSAVGATNNKQNRDTRIARSQLDDSLIPHGSLSGYSAWYCRCAACVDAGRERNRLRSEAAGRTYKPRRSRHDK